MRVRLRQMRDKERALTRQKQREVRGKAEPRGGSFPDAQHPLHRKQVFAAALKRVNKELGRVHKRRPGPPIRRLPGGRLRCAARRNSCRIRPPAIPLGKACARSRASAVEPASLPARSQGFAGDKGRAGPRDSRN